MTVSNRVAVFALLPAIAVLFFGLASIFVYPTTIEARVSILSSIATSVTVLFLISERLRDSALRKLEFLNRRAFTPTLKASRDTIQRVDIEQSRVFSKSRDVLTHHGKFMRLRFYPKNLLDVLERAKTAVTMYELLFQKTCNAGYKEVGQANFNIWAVLKGLDFEVIGNYPDSLITPHKEIFQRLVKGDPELEKLPVEGRKVMKAKGEILKLIEDFFNENQLEEIQDALPSYSRLP